MRQLPPKYSELLCCMGFAQKAALERLSELENENAALREAADRRSKVLHQSRSFINAYLQVRPSLSSPRTSVLPVGNPHYAIAFHIDLRLTRQV